jgi:hypothetical protein
MEKHTESEATTPPQLNPAVDLTSFDSYYREEFNKIIQSNETYKGKWNWYAFLFSWIWCVVKGAWVYGLIVLASMLLTFGSKLSFFVGVGWAIIMGLRGNWLLYNAKVKNKQFPKSLF